VTSQTIQKRKNIVPSMGNKQSRSKPLIQSKSWLETLDLTIRESVQSLCDALNIDVLKLDRDQRERLLGLFVGDVTMRSTSDQDDLPNQYFYHYPNDSKIKVHNNSSSSNITMTKTIVPDFHREFQLFQSRHPRWQSWLSHNCDKQITFFWKQHFSSLNLVLRRQCPISQSQQGQNQSPEHTLTTPVIPNPLHAPLVLIMYVMDSWRLSQHEQDPIQSMTLPIKHKYMLDVNMILTKTMLQGELTHPYRGSSLIQRYIIQGDAYSRTFLNALVPKWNITRFYVPRHDVSPLMYSLILDQIQSNLTNIKRPCMISFWPGSPHDITPELLSTISSNATSTPTSIVIKTTTPTKIYGTSFIIVGSRVLLPDEKQARILSFKQRQQLSLEQLDNVVHYMYLLQGWTDGHYFFEISSIEMGQLGAEVVIINNDKDNNLILPSYLPVIDDVDFAESTLNLIERCPAEG
jgi:hypothetical protein